jgi:DNA-binding NarL/FixJ family response regulator
MLGPFTFREGWHRTRWARQSFANGALRLLCNDDPLSTALMKRELTVFAAPISNAGLPELPTSTHDIVIVHGMPLIRLGLHSTINNASALDSYRIFAFTTLVQAKTNITNAVAGDVIILDGDAWSSLTSPLNSTAFESIRARGPSLAIIAPCSQLEIDSSKACRLSGSIALEAELEEIVFMIEDLAANSSSIAGQPIPSDKQTRLSSLSCRQFEILELMADGFTNKQVAHVGGMSEASVKYHVTRILKKLGCSRRAQAVVLFMASCAAAKLND